MSGFEVIGGISGIITIVESCNKVFQSLRKDYKLPETLIIVSSRLPILSSTLRSCTIRFEAVRDSMTDEVCSAVKAIVEHCEANAQKLQGILDTILAQKKDGELKQVLKRFGKNREVEAVLAEINTDVQLLVNHDAVQSTSAGMQGALHTQAPIRTMNGSETPSAQIVEGLGACLGAAPYIDPSFFVGRTAEIAQIRDMLHPKHKTPGQRRVVIGGQGGFGKTQLALAYARQNQTLYPSIIWADATSRNSLTASLHSVIGHISSNKSEQIDESATANVQTWLSDRKNTAWLLIVDNYDEPDAFDLSSLLPLSLHGSIIVTTRCPDRVSGQILTLKPLSSVQEGLEILKTRSGRQNLEKGNETPKELTSDLAATEVVQRLQGLPLALATAGTYLRNTTTSCRAYLDAYERQWLINQSRCQPLLEYKDRTLYTTWNISYARLKEQNMEAAILLQLLAFFDNQNLDIGFVHDGYRLNKAGKTRINMGGTSDVEDVGEGRKASHKSTADGIADDGESSDDENADEGKEEYVVEEEDQAEEMDRRRCATIRIDLPIDLLKALDDEVLLEKSMRVLAQHCFILPCSKRNSWSWHNCVHDWLLTIVDPAHCQALFLYAYACIDAVAELGMEKLCRKILCHAQRLGKIFLEPQFASLLVWLKSSSLEKVDQVVRIAATLAIVFKKSGARKLIIRLNAQVFANYGTIISPLDAMLMAMESCDFAWLDEVVKQLELAVGTYVNSSGLNTRHVMNARCKLATAYLDFGDAAKAELVVKAVIDSPDLQKVKDKSVELDALQILAQAQYTLDRQDACNATVDLLCQKFKVNQESLSFHWILRHMCFYPRVGNYDAGREHTIDMCQTLNRKCNDDLIVSPDLEERVSLHANLSLLCTQYRLLEAASDQLRRACKHAEIYASTGEYCTPKLLYSLANLSFLCWKEGLAERYCKEVLSHPNSTETSSKIWVFKARNLLIRLYRDSGRIDLAREYYEGSLEFVDFIEHSEFVSFHLGKEAIGNLHELGMTLDAYEKPESRQTPISTPRRIWSRMKDRALPQRRR